MFPRWQNQEEAVTFAKRHPAVMLDFDMGTGKTRVAIDTAFELEGIKWILVLCPKAVVPVWRTNLEKFAMGEYDCWDVCAGTVEKKAEKLREFINEHAKTDTPKFIVINYDSAWRGGLGDILSKLGWSMIILDESHRVKAAGSKISRFVAKIGRRAQHRMCLSGTPMANSPLDVYGQYRFLDPSIFGTNYYEFLSKYAIMGGPEMRFVVGFKNQKELSARFNSIAVTCKMADIRARLKLPASLPDVVRKVSLPRPSMKIMEDLEKDFISSTQEGTIVVSNVLVKMLRCQQVASGFCFVQEGPMEDGEISELNTAKADALADILEDIGPASVVVFCTFKHDLDVIQATAERLDRKTFELSGRRNELSEWQKRGGVLAVQIQAGAEGVDMTKANHAIYFSLPHSLALYNQSRARLYRPGQRNPVSFIHIIADKTIDTYMYRALEAKEDIIAKIKAGNFNFGYMKGCK